MRLGLAVLALLLASPAVAQTPNRIATAPAASPAYQPPRTPDGRPDFQGVWSNKWLTPVEKSGRIAALVATPEEERIIVDGARKMAKQLGDYANDPEAGDPDAHALTKVRGEYRTRMVVAPEDGALPYSPEGVKAMQAQQSWFSARVMRGVADGPEDRLTWERCLAGMGQAPLLYGWAVGALRRVVQTRDALVIHSEAGGETRIIRIGGEPLPSGMRSFIGDSVGQWEGDTLVVDTTGFRKEDSFRMSVTGRPIMVGPQARVIERFTRISADELNYQFTVEDPVNYSKPWLAEYSMARSSEAMFEFACHEGNYGLANILSGARAIEQRKAAAAPVKGRQ
jgi:hypothetical protein